MWTLNALYLFFPRKPFWVKIEGKFLLAAISICGISNHSALVSIHNTQERPTLPLRNLLSVCEDLAKYRIKTAFPFPTLQTEKAIVYKVQLIFHQLYWCQYHSYPEISITGFIFNACLPPPTSNEYTPTTQPFPLHTVY